MKTFKTFLQFLNESKSNILDAFVDVFDKDVVFNKKHFYLDSKKIDVIWNILNRYLFENKLSKIPVKYLTYEQICNELKKTYEKTYEKTLDKSNYEKNINNFINPKNDFYGVFNALINNNDKYISLKSNLIFEDEQILINKSKLENKSFPLVCASICHEMIHYYDKEFGQYIQLQKIILLTHVLYDTHKTMTFMKKKKEANDNYINVISKCDLDTDIDEARAIDLAIKAMNENISFSKKRIMKNSMKNIGDLTIINDNYIMVTTY